jgi:branched-chain amino acid transport system permease protein
MLVLIEQSLNGLQFGLLLFLLAAGLTLVFGIMDFVNLAHGSLYMMGAYFAAAGFNAFGGSFLAAALVAVPGTLLLGLLVERLLLSTLYRREHLDQVLATFGLILFFNEVVRYVWGPSSVYMNVPKWLSGTVELFGLPYPSYRFAIIAVGLLVGGALYALIHRTRVGMLIRAGATNPQMVSALGVDIKRLNSVVFAIGAGLAGLAGLMAGPIVSVQSGRECL